MIQWLNGALEYSHGVLKPQFFCLGAMESYKFLAQSPGALNPFGTLICFLLYNYYDVLFQYLLKCMWTLPYYYCYY